MFLFVGRRRPTSTLFPYTTLFRSLELHGGHDPRVGRADPRVAQAGPRRVRLLQQRRAGLRAAQRYAPQGARPTRSEEHTSELQSLTNLVCRLLLEKKKTNQAQLVL